MKRKKFIVAIDGPAGAGKSTVSKSLARKMKYLYIDTGAMYRALALKAIRLGYDFADEKKVVPMAEKTKLVLKPAKKPGDPVTVILDGKDVSGLIRTEEVSHGASAISTVQGVRKVLQDKQRILGKNGGIVMEGRDIGTVVFPDAEFKFYMDASSKERARRRYKELLAKGTKITLAEIEKEIKRRDDRDKNRKNDPLKQAEGSIYFDSTGLTIDETADELLKIIRKRK